MNYCYLDWASTSPILEEVLSEYLRVSRETTGNPSSRHRYGTKALEILSQSRLTAANVLKVRPENLVFTSGGSEGNMLILSSLLMKRRRGTVIISGIEHPSVYEYGSILREAGFTPVYLTAPNGIIKPESLLRQLREDTVMVTAMLVNNVTGSIQPIEEMAALTRKYAEKLGKPIHFHTDAVQALGKIDFSLEKLGVDSASFSFHKIQGPKGMGLLYTTRPMKTLSSGGNQEFSVRAGTEALPLIAAAVTALDHTLENFSIFRTHAAKLQSIIVEFIKKRQNILTLMPGFSPSANSPFITSFSCKDIPSEILVRVMDDRGFAISAGSACSSKSRKKRERVLKYMMYDDSILSSAVRVSVGPETTSDHVYAFCTALEQELTLLHKTLGKR
jgi:cysteine desulfurase